MIKMNDYMRILKGEGWCWNWHRFSKLYKPVSVDCPDIEKDVLKVIIELFGDNYITWLDEPILELNNYTPRQLMETKSGVRIIKGYLMRMQL